MNDYITLARTQVSAALVAAVTVSPFEPALSEEELRGLIVGRDGIGAGAFADALRQMGNWPRDKQHRLQVWAPQMHLLLSGPVPDELRPGLALDALGKAFDTIDNELGKGVNVERSVLHARCHPIPPEVVDRALGFALAVGSVVRDGDTFGRRGSWQPYGQHPQNRARASGPKGVCDCALELLPGVRDVFARRAGAHAPTEPSVDRFGRFLHKQNWIGLGTWWSLTSAEMRSLVESSHPGAICILCGALLEGALVAVSSPARDAQEWKRDFLAEPSERWKLQELIDQAYAAKWFTEPQKQRAVEIGNIRNRIHAGRFQVQGKFSPPHTNAHEARVSRDSLDVLLTALLDHAVMRKLA